MTETILIADSGGTKTDWCAITDGKRIFFETKSCHPTNWNEPFWHQLSDELEKYVDLASTVLYFFGAGCLNQENKTIAETEFKKMKLSKVRVKSDLHGAGYALFGKKDGVGIISGTGSVLFYWEKEQIVHRVGGKGHLEGDEGSGFYFGKILREKWRNNELSTEQKKSIPSEAKNVLMAQHLKDEKFDLASLSKLLGSNSRIFEDLHEENINCFMESHFDGGFPTQIALLGGYGYVNQSLWKSILSKRGIELTVVLDKPIVSLVEQLDSFVD